jgi:Flp pilus assembly protein TadG
MMSPRTRLRRHRDEAGYAAVLVALLASTVFLGVSAMGVDTARWYVEVEHVQKAADAAALAGVTYMPNDLPKARTAALSVAKTNGYDDADPDIVVTVDVGDKPSELEVTISSRVDNAFGRALGIAQSDIERSAVADYTAPAPMGSPCNTFGNEPPGTSTGPSPGAGTALPTPAFVNCPKDPVTQMSTPNFWAGVEGPETDKLQGDRYQAKKCTETGNTGGPTYKCGPGTTPEYKEDGYYFIVHVEPEAVGTPIDVQVYDAAFVPGGLTCGSLPQSTSLSNNMNPWVTTDGKDRYSRNSAGQKFCSGDAFVGSSTTSRGTNTTFVMRDTSQTNNPAKSSPLAACPAKQFRGFTSAPSVNALTSGTSSYNDQLAQVFHTWYSVCTFTPTKDGDYYLQVRTNVSLGGSSATNTNGRDPVVYTGNGNADDETGNNYQGAGANAFAVRAVPNVSSLRDNVAVSAWERMPILQIATSPATFNLVRALPNAKGQYLTFDFFDAADGSAGTVKILPPGDATGDVMLATGIPGCRAGKNDTSPALYTSLTGCSFAVNGNNTDGQLIHMVIPIPDNYTCDNSFLGGCWFQVKLEYGASVTDFTTWSANVGGDPVRLIE